MSLGMLNKSRVAEPLASDLPFTAKTWKGGAEDSGASGGMFD